MEHRWGHRKTVDLAVQLAPIASLAEQEGTLTDLSLSGAFIRLSGRIKALIRVHVRLPADPHHRYLAHTLEAFVVRRTDEGVGVEWSQFSPPPIVCLLRSPSIRPHAHIAHAEQAAMRARRLSAREIAVETAEAP
jgi:hypothetical protein